MMILKIKCYSYHTSGPAQDAARSLYLRDAQNSHGPEYQTQG